MHRRGSRSEPWALQYLEVVGMKEPAKETQGGRRTRGGWCLGTQMKKVLEEGVLRCAQRC